MKKILLSVCVIIGTITMSHAQSTIFKPFKVDMGLGYGFGKAKGVVFHLEPKYSIKDELAVGLRIESAILGNIEADNSTVSSVDLSAIGSYLVTGDYYFSNRIFRPLAGLGMGVYSMGGVKVQASDNIDETVDINVGTKFGLAPRVGFEVGHFRMGLEYNLITGQPKNFNRNYFSTKIGVVFGGGRRK